MFLQRWLPSSCSWAVVGCFCFVLIFFFKWLSTLETNDCCKVSECGMGMASSCTTVCRRCSCTGVCSGVNMSSVCKLSARRGKKALQCRFIIVRNRYGGWINSSHCHLTKHMQKTKSREIQEIHQFEDCTLTFRTQMLGNFPAWAWIVLHISIRYSTCSYSHTLAFTFHIYCGVNDRVRCFASYLKRQDFNLFTIKICKMSQWPHCVTWI